MAAVSQLIGQGIGFSPGDVGFIVRDGLSGAAAPVVAGTSTPRQEKRGGPVVTRRRPSERLSFRGGIVGR